MTDRTIRVLSCDRCPEKWERAEDEEPPASWGYVRCARIGENQKTMDLCPRCVTDIQKKISEVPVFTR